VPDVAALEPTPGQTVGPFFHDALPFPGDRELVPPGLAAAVRLHGHVYDGEGSPVPDALLEVRQAGPDGTVPSRAGSLRRRGALFTGWGRSSTDATGHYWFSTVEPGASPDQVLPFFAVTVLARGLLHRLFTRAYLPAAEALVERDALLSRLHPQERRTLLAMREDDGSLRFDVHLQGPQETVFLRFARSC
jgi:protocatechuate 3,4-dioxygenase alpha subunit